MDEKQQRTQAVALRYDPERDTAPVVLAKGKGEIAEKILELARACQVPVYSDPNLVEVLSKLDLGYAIPPELYKAVAEVLAFVYRINGKYQENR